jgi:predicted nucleotidyltransferase
MCIVTPILNTRALVKLCQHNDVARLSVFGSFARGEGTERSDVDLLVEFRKRNSLLALIALERKMSAALGRRVDLLTREAISPYLRESIERDLRVVYEAR